MSHWQATLTQLAHSPTFAVALTLLAFLLALQIYRKTGSVLLQPVVIAVTLVISVLLLCDIPYTDYRTGAQPIAFLIGPATIALAVPLYRQLRRIKELLLPITLVICCGGFLTVALTLTFAWLMGASLPMQMSLAPRSVTMPIALLIAEQSGGVASLAAAFVMITGVMGTAMAPGLLRLAKVTEPAARGLSYGVNAHAIGTIKALEEGEECGAFAALGMGLLGILVALLLPMLLAAS